MKIPAKFSVVALLVLVMTVTADATELTVIELHNRTANDVIPILRPLVGSDAALTGIDYKLLIRASASDVARIREALAVLDKAPKQLLISVRYDAAPQNSHSEIGAGNVSNRGSQIVVRGGVTMSTASDSNVSRVRVLEGNAAHIATGQSIPIVSTIMISPRNGAVIGATTDYRELASGFDVLPRVNGDRVMLDISTRQEQATDASSGAATVQRATTTIAGRLGEWIDLGGVTSSASEESVAVGTGGATTRVATQSDQRNIAVKVEQVD